MKEGLSETVALFLCKVNKNGFFVYICMVKLEHIGTVQYSKVLDTPIEIKEGLSDEFYISVGLESVLEKKDAPVKMTFPKQKNDSDK
jgi:hypothetical protein